ncbi:hypothetical protein [Streptomyces cyaneus]|uniref:hypothetical protein n=1 Tax=Streptomyces cyaneus TaxID=1904 RepID=UPI000FF88AE0|nr:hypothetical protein [Streptomyces cyaneus]
MTTAHGGHAPTDPSREPGEIVDEFGTGFLRTRVRRHGRGFVWERSAGELRREPFSAVSDEVRAAVSAVVPESAPGVAGVLPVLGVPQDGARRYPAGAARSVGHLLLSALDARQRGLLHHLLYEVGRTVRRVHEGVPVRLATGRPRGAARLASWLRTTPSRTPSPTPSSDAPHAHLPNLHALAARRLGPDRLARVLGWCDELAVGGEGDVFLLGGVGSGALVPGAAPGAGVLLAGEELARGPAAYDVGWLLGELAEFRLVHLTRPEHADLAEHCAESARSFLRGYGDHGTDPVALGRAAALRVFTHAHDYAAYVGWTDEFPAYLDCIAELIDTDGTAAVRPTTLETG